MKTVAIVIFSFVGIQLSYSQTTADVPARYYTMKGKMADGFIKPSAQALDYLNFTSADGDAKRVYLSNLKAVVMGQDSFAIIRDFRVESEYSEKTVMIEIGLGKVVETGKLTLFQVYYNEIRPGHYSTNRLGHFNLSGTDKYAYMLAASNTQKPVYVEMATNDFSQQMLPYFCINEQLCNAIKNKEYSYLKIRELVKAFNEWYNTKDQPAR